MTRKQRAQNGGGNETWDLSSSRGLQAFRSLMEKDDGPEDEEAGPSSRQSSGTTTKGRRARAASHASERRVPFQLREDVEGARPQAGHRMADRAAGGADAPRDGDGDAAAWLARQLGPTASSAAGPDLIREVLSGCGGDAGAALEALGSMLGIGSGDGDGTAEQQQPQRQPPPPTATAVLWWGALHPSLPGDLQDAVLGRLPVRDLARWGCTSRGARAAALREMARARTVAAPAACASRPAVLRGMVAALSGASAVDLSRAMSTGPRVPEGALHATMEREQRLAALLGAVAEGEGLRAARAAHAEEGGGSSGWTPVSRLVFARGAAEGLTDAVLREWVLGKGGGNSSTGAPAPLPNVRELSAARAPLTSAALVSLARHQAPGGGGGGGLESLSLNECLGLRDDGVRALFAEGAPSRAALRRLDVSGCPQLTTAALRPLHTALALRSLRAANLPGLRGDLALLLPEGGGAASLLEELDLSGSTGLGGTLTLSAPRLRVLNVRGCRRLARLQARLPALERLLAGDCPFLASIEGLPAVAAAGAAGPEAPPMQQLRPFFAPQLREAELRGCASLGDAAARAALLSDGTGRAPCLERADLSATSINVLDLLPENLAPRLERLNVSGCRQLVRLAAGGARLLELRAGNCGRLASLTLLAPVSRGLEVLQLSNCADLSAVAVGRRRGSSEDGGGSGGARGGEDEEEEDEGGAAAAGRGARGSLLLLDGTPKLSAADEAALRALARPAV